ncbi:BatD family protein [Dyella sp. GSA-30]|uniref:BatD family protein n=1 Tax=Dyella sp. GSA-30 TaxID=2994496 RepID=UPI00248F5778|nr:BatD family protein [Dyella sp. GSA-30]BDU18655.1 membrane protein [Dyella sp. GSA-30]
MKRTLRTWLSGLFLLVLSLPAWASIQATLDRDRVQLGEIVTLNIRIQGAITPQPVDMAELAPDFDVVNSSAHASLTVVNGHPEAALMIGLVLKPKHAGDLTIPALRVGGLFTSPISLEVDEPDPVAAPNNRKNVYLEASVEPAKGYVGQQLQYVLRLYFATSLSAGALDDPQADGASFQRLGNDLNYETDQGGRHYHVIERRYALVPQRAGKLVIPPVQFQGESVDMNDPDTFFPNSQPVAASTPSVTVNVQGVPANADKQTWLPVRDLKLTAEGLPDGGDMHVGQPLNLTMLLQATGASYDSLPAPSLPPIDGANVYPDKPLNGTRSDGTSLVGRRQQSFAIIPSRPGTLVIPEITVHWWNVITGQPEVARLPERRFTVLPAVGQPAAASSVRSTAPVPVAVDKTASPATGVPWRWIALASLALWLLSVLVWWLRRRAVASEAGTRTNKALATPRQLRAAFIATAQGGDATKQAHALMAWAKAERPALQNLGDLADELGSAEQREAIAALQRRRYAAHGTTGSAAGLAACFSGGFVWKTLAPPSSTNGLPSLYPFDVHGDDKRPSPQD